MAPQLHATPVSVQRMQRCSTGYKIVLYSIVLAKKMKWEEVYALFSLGGDSALQALRNSQSFCEGALATRIIFTS